MTSYYVKCFTCGNLGHVSAKCPGRLCFHCSRPGHISKNCPKRPRESSSGRGGGAIPSATKGVGGGIGTSVGRGVGAGVDRGVGRGVSGPQSPPGNPPLNQLLPSHNQPSPPNRNFALAWDQGPPRVKYVDAAKHARNLQSSPPNPPPDQQPSSSKQLLSVASSSNQPSSPVSPPNPPAYPLSSWYNPLNPNRVLQAIIAPQTLRSGKHVLFPDATLHRRNDVTSDPSLEEWSIRDNRWERVLDTLATLCVHKEKDQVVSCSLGINGDVIKIWVSTNEPSPNLPVINPFLHRLWKCLQVWHERIEDARMPPLESSEKLETTTPYHPTTEGICAAERAVLYWISQHGRARILRELYKGSESTTLNDFFTSLNQRRNNSTAINSADALMSDFQSKVEEARTFFSDTRNWNTEDLPWYERNTVFLKLYFLIRSLYEMGEKMLDDRAAIASWEQGSPVMGWRGLQEGRGGKNPIKSSIDLRRYIKKKINLGRHFFTLANWVYSVRTGHVLDRRLELYPIYLPKPDLPALQPRQLEESLDAFKEAGSDKEPKTKYYLRKKALEPCHRTIHAEVVQLLFHSKNESSPPPLSYFGVSKFSCYGCSQLFKIVRDKSTLRDANGKSISTSLPLFKTRGTSDKVYGVWTLMPDLPPKLAGLDVWTPLRDRFLADDIAFTKNVDTAGSDESAQSRAGPLENHPKMEYINVGTDEFVSP